MVIPYDINHIQPIATQLWNCDEVLYDPNGRWHKVICTYNFFQGERMWKVKTGERSLFWCTLLVFTQAGGKCFMPSIIVHQAKEYSQDLQFNVTLDWTVHNTPSGYINREEWLKSMYQLSNVLVASPVNNQILFFDGYDSHFDKRALRQIKCRNIRLFVLKSGNSINNQTNDNGPNYKLKSLYNVAKTAWILKYGTTNVLPHRMNYVLVKALDAFNISSEKIIRDSFAKTILSPLISIYLTTHTQAFSTSVQVSSEPKAEKSTIYHSRKLHLFSYK